MSGEIPSSLKLRVYSFQRVMVDDHVQEVTIPGLDGYFGIFPGHRPMVLALGKGRFSYRISGREKTHLVEGGYAEISPEDVLVFTAESEEDEYSPDEG
ncbi:MAG: hypothetical protein R6V02_01170 [Candidatus Aminicenantes bacterium]